MKTELIHLGESEIIKVSQDTQFVLDLSHGKHDVAFVFDKEGVSAEIIGVYKLKPNEEMNLTTITDHRARNTSCVTKIKGALSDGSKSTYLGKIIIRKSAQQTSSFLEDNVLVVGEGTYNNSQPILEIDADDVKASHGATTGRVDESSVYYLMSRGLSKTESENLVVEGFFESLISKIEDEKVRSEVRSHVA